MTFEEAFEMMAKKYFEGLTSSELRGDSGKKPKYTKKYFDKVAKDYEINQDDLKGFDKNAV